MKLYLCTEKYIHYEKNELHKTITSKRIVKPAAEAEIKRSTDTPLCLQRVHESKKVYNRRKIKAADKKLPYFFVFKIASLSSRHSDTIQ